MNQKTNIYYHYPIVYYHGFVERCIATIHLHDTYEIFQACSDNIKYFVEGSAYMLNKGDIIITSNRELHRPITLDKNIYGRRFIQFKPSQIPIFDEIPYNPLHIFENRELGKNNHLVTTKESKILLETYFNKLENELIKKDKRNQYRSKLILFDLLVFLEKLYESSTLSNDNEDKIDPRIKSLRNYLDNNFTKAFNLDNISKKFLTDKYLLSRLFKENTGFTILEYIQSKRINYAISLLEENKSITDICQIIGYSDYSNFYKTFKKITNFSPKDYRDKIIKENYETK